MIVKEIITKDYFLANKQRYIDKHSSLVKTYEEDGVLFIPVLKEDFYAFTEKHYLVFFKNNVISVITKDRYHKMIDKGEWILEKDESAMTDKEDINHPSRYGGDTVYEVIKVIEAWKLDFHLGNVVKYIGRLGKKDSPLKELKKARWYLDRKIEQLQEQQSEE